MAIFDFVQKTDKTIAVANAVTAIATNAFGSSVSTGSLIVVSCQMQVDAGQTVTSVTDSQGNTYVKAFGPQLGLNVLAPWSSEVWYALNVTGGSSFVVTVHYNATGGFRKSIAATEYVGDSTVALDVSDSARGTSTTAGVTVTTTGTYELVYCDFDGGASAGAANSPLAEEGSGAVIQTGSYKTTSTGSHTASWALSPSQDWVCLLAAFSATVGGGSTTAGPLAQGALIKSLIGQGLVN